MPTYEYICAACSHQWEEIQRITADPLEQCPKCSQRTARRQITGGNFILKGGGWYADAYSSKPATKSEGGASEAKAEGSTETKTEKAETKTEKAETKTEKAETKTDAKPKADTKPPSSTSS